MADTIAGMVGGIASTYIGVPLDLIKTRMQAQNQVFRTPFESFKNIIRNEGILALWKGAIPAASTGLIENFVVFTANGLLRKLFVRQDESPSFKKEIILNGASAIFSATAITPTEVIKCRLYTVLGHNEHSHITTSMKDIYNEAGLRGYFRGLPATMIRDIPFYMIFFSSYTYYTIYVSQYYYHNEYDRNNLPVWHSILGGGLTGALGWSVVFPMDTIKSRQQAEHGNLTFNETLTKIFNENGSKNRFKNGIFTLYKGWTPCVLRGFPVNGALIFVVENTKKLFHLCGFHPGYSLGTTKSFH